MSKKVQATAAPSGFDAHDHEACISRSVAAFEAHCADVGAQLTPVRRRVLEILLREHRAMGAYDILDILRAENLGSQPPIAYRALDFLVTHGAVHKIEKRNAFIACAHPGTTHAPSFMICRACDTVAEAAEPMMGGGLEAAADKMGFTIERAVIEAEGLCPKCKDAPVQ
jgi:Fur family zinc uptake transcriptional regulator